MFPNGWPGRGLLLLRFVAGILLIHDGIIGPLISPPWEAIAMRSIAAGAGIFILAGFCTPIAGVVVVLVELGAVLSRADSLRGSLVLASLGAALAMLGPGVRSIDARLFGRKRIEIPDR
jgi:putative oxidoreductase